MKSLSVNRKEKGFTIIELVVVILLLGILTATALPRFISIENEAHDAVVTAIETGMRTSAGLFRAQWYAEGQPNTVAGYDSHRATNNGYPMGIFAGTNRSGIPTAADCVEIYSSMLQPQGRPSIAVYTSAGGVPTAASGTITTDFVAFLDNTSSATRKLCYFIYTGQFNDSGDGGLPVLIYSTITGDLTYGTEL